MAVGSFRLPITTSPQEDWVRPSDWLPMQTGITEADQIFVGLHAVFPSGQNYAAFIFTTSAGQYQVDWGDGTVTLHNSNTIAQYDYDYASISGSTLTSRGYKQAIITVTPVSGNLLTCNFQARYVTSPVQNQAYSTGFLDCILSMPSANSGASIVFGGGTVRNNYVERVDFKTIGLMTDLNTMFSLCRSLQNVPLFNTTNVTNMAFMFNGCFSLKSVPLFNTENVTSMASMFVSCYSLQNIPLFNTANVSSMRVMFNSCYSLKSVPLFNTENVTSMASMFATCYSLQNIPLFNTENVTRMESMFGTCFSLQNIPLFNTENVTNMSDIFSSCSVLNSIPALSTASITPTSGTDFGNFATSCNSLDKCEMVFARTVSLTNCQLSQSALVEIFTNLVDRSATTSANINISGNWGASALTASDGLIATSKNWTITG